MVEPTNTSPTPTSTRPKRRFQWIHLQKIGPAFWTFSSILSLAVNLILFGIIIALASQLFEIKRLVSTQLIDGLYDNFVLMDQAHIRTVIPVRDQKVRANFTLKIETPTTVRLSQDTVLSNAIVSQLSTGGLTIYNAPAEIVLKAGTELPILLNLEVPVDQEIPVNLDVNVDIPLKDTELHQPFAGLQEVVAPYRTMMNDLPDSWAETFCGPQPAPLCLWLFSGK